MLSRQLTHLLLAKQAKTGTALACFKKPHHQRRTKLHTVPSTTYYVVVRTVFHSPKGLHEICPGGVCTRLTRLTYVLSRISRSQQGIAKVRQGTPRHRQEAWRVLSRGGMVFETRARLPRPAMKLLPFICVPS